MRCKPEPRRLRSKGETSPPWKMGCPFSHSRPDARWTSWNFQGTKVGDSPNRSERYGDNKIQPMEVETIWMPRRRHHPVEINTPNSQTDRGDKKEAFNGRFCFATE